MHINGIDAVDNKIVNLLLRDGRMSYSDIAEEVGLTRPAVKNRIKALEESGIIGGYRAVINPQNASEMMTFIVSIETTAENFDTAKAAFCDAEETVTIVQTTGRCYLMAVCVSKDVREMKNFLNKMYKEVPGILSVNANAVLDVIKGSIISEK